jgi:hypothetical protein
MKLHTSKYSSIVVLLLIASGLFSCKKSLEQYNPGGLTAEAVYSTPEGFETLVNAAYSYQRWWYGKEEGYCMTDPGTDIWDAGQAEPDPGLTDYLHLEGSDSYVTQLWQNLYAAVNVCNYGITNIDKVGLAEDLKNTREAELRFLRAFYYWHIVATWGAAPMPLKPTQGIETTAVRTSVDSIYAQIFKDLNFADAHLPITTSDYGRATKPAAEALLARMDITRGKNQEALDMANNVINNYGFHLIARYADLWPMDKMAAAEDSEVIYAVNYTENLSLDDHKDPILFPYGHKRGGNNGHLDFLMKYDDQPGMQRSIEYGRPFVRFMPTKFLLDLFNDQIDSRYKGSFETVWYCNNQATAPAGMQLGDTAVLVTKAVVPESVRKGKLYRIYDINDTYNQDGSIKDNQHFVQLKKFMDPTRSSINEQISPRDVFVIRLAEMYLIAGEAEFKMNNLQKAADYINVVRERAALPGHKTDMDAKPADITLDFILDEYAREFAGEQLRWFVLKREGKLVDRVKAHNPDAGKNIQPYHVVRPIPQNQLDAVTNPDDFKQNPGYQ